ncbi:MAG: transketolase [Candidatus Altiarchaeales archaeon]|nr:transketolase [Candidatus Altiarchaeales archaeon]MBD3416616.1 transketolase [Candidatus Altiarchaeales archaeon]
MVDQDTIKLLNSKAKAVRKHILEMTTEAGSGHPGGSMSALEVIVTLYFYKMRHRSADPEWVDRDRFVLSKGHAAPALYSVLAESGYIPVKELKRFRHADSFLEGHPCRKSIPGVDVSTGSLGQGLSVACGIALAGKLDKRDYRVYVILGDGESQEGQIWEAAMSAAHYRLDNLCVVVDRNSLQIDGSTEEVMSIEPLADKWSGFGWNVLTVDGHNFEEIINALDEAELLKDSPTVLIANTTKGKGVSFMENVAEFHGKPLSREQLCEALKELV